MTPFLDLWNSCPDLSPGEKQELVRRRLPEVIVQSPLGLWSSGQPVPGGKRLLIGVAPYSQADLHLLDLLANHLQSANGRIRIEVFDVLECQTHEDFGRYIPGIGKVFQTPIVGLWENGLLKENATGHRARELIVRECGLNLSALLPSSNSSP